jgi:hypothetical protein
MTGTMSPGFRSTAIPRLTLPRKMTLFPETAELTMGNSRRVLDTAQATKAV